MVGDRFYIKATATLIDIETKEETFSVALAREEESKKGMDGSQVTGASSSYARKYALNGLFAIDDTKDADAQKPTEQDPKLITPEQVKEMFATGKGDTMKVKEICLRYGYTSSKDIKKDDFEKIIKELEVS